MTSNPLVATARNGPTDPWSGVWIAEDIEQIAHGISSGNWIDTTLGGISAGLDALALISDPVGALLQYGVAWLIEHVKPLSEALDWLAGDPAQIAAHAQTWRNVAKSLHGQVDDITRAVHRDLEGWAGTAAPAYRAWSQRQQQGVYGLARASEVMALITEAAGLLVATVRLMVRDAIATLVSRLISYAIEEAASLGFATPLVVEQVSILCASWAARIAGWLRALVSSLRELARRAGRLGSRIDDLKKILDQLHRRGHAGPSGVERAGPRQTGAQIRRPRNDLDFEMSWADDAYDKIRASDDDVAAIADTARQHGFSLEDIQKIKDHVFRNEHLLDSYPPPTVARFDANPRMAEAWIRLMNGTPHPADFDLLRHEKFEAAFMTAMGDQSYSRAHAATLEAGYTWDPEAAANDGIGHQFGR